MILGSHVSCQGGLAKAVGRAADVGCQCLQIFVSNPPRQWPVKAAPESSSGHDQPDPGQNSVQPDRQWVAKPLADKVIEAWNAAIADSSLQNPIAHASYLINMATPDDALFRKSIDALVAELHRGNRLNLDGLVVHPGAFTKSCEADGLTRIVDALGELLGRVEAGSCRLLLENTAGQGTCLGHTIDQLAVMLDGVDAPDRVGVCLDTCHAFAAGYEINTPAGFAELRQKIEDSLPANSIAALHLNDSKKPLGSRVDRHEHIGRGEIGLDGFRHVLADPLLGSLPGYLETEKGIDDESGEDWDVINLRTLRSL